MVISMTQNFVIAIISGDGKKWEVIILLWIFIGHSKTYLMYCFMNLIMIAMMVMAGIFILLSIREETLASTQAIILLYLGTEIAPMVQWELLMLFLMNLDMLFYVTLLAGLIPQAK